MIEQPPDGIIITIGAKMIEERGYRNWLSDFLLAMRQEDWTYWMKLGSRPKREDFMYVYLCIGGKIRFRANFVMSYGSGMKEFADGREMFGRAWVVLSGPVVKPDAPILLKGFRGFRYTEKLF
jgi:hypothetical protein